MKIILASASPRRREILAGFGLKFDIITADVDENVSTDGKTPPMIVEEISRRKALAVYERLLQEQPSADETAESGADGTLIIAADTVVCSGGEILGKPHDREDAKRMLKGYSGKTHSVISAVTTVRFNGTNEPKIESFHDISYVTFKKMTDEEIDYYLDTDEPYDKAGAYAVQGFASLFIESIEGSFYNIVGLPVQKLYEACGGIEMFKK